MINDKIISELKEDYLFLNYLRNGQFNKIEDIVKQINNLNSIEDLDRIKKLVIEIIGEIVGENGKQPLYKYLLQLSLIEYNTRDFKFSKRDHVIHTLLTFMVGAYINEFFMKQNNSLVDGSFEWRIAALFHDIGYVFAISNDLAYKQDRKMYEIINEITGCINNENTLLDFYERYSNLSQGKNAFDLIYKRLNEWDIDVKSVIEHIKELKKCPDEGKMNIDHGVMSALVLLYTLDQIYQSFNPNRQHGPFYKEVVLKGEAFYLDFSQDIFEENIVNICSAIFVHSLDEVCFVNKKIDIHKAKLAYLLKLSDEIQDWNRLNFLNKKSNPQEQYDINVINNRLEIRFKDVDFKNIIDKYLSPENLIIETIRA